MRVNIPELTKVCRDCGIEKDINDFYVANSMSGARRPECKMCQGLGRFHDNPMLLQAATAYIAERMMTYSRQ